MSSMTWAMSQGLARLRLVRAATTPDKSYSHKACVGAGAAAAMHTLA
jgi:hypothetical protein